MKRTKERESAVTNKKKYFTNKAKECVNESENLSQPAGIEVSKLGQRQRPGQR